MCGRYALGMRPWEIWQQLQDAGMPAEEVPEENDVRQTYNFAPGNIGIVYRADVPDHGSRRAPNEEDRDPVGNDGSPSQPEKTRSASVEETGTKYKLQAMKWGLVPFWTKRNPDYPSIIRTINCRDDSLMEDRGMWTSMKKWKRCVVVAQGFYEWLKKNNGKEKIPHYTKRKDGQLMCFAGLWDCVTYEGSDEKLYTYTIITTDSNKQLSFLHDRMPVILENGSDALRKWLDPSRNEWSHELQSLLRPYEGELECYPVSKEVGKVGNNSPSFIVPVDSAENKSNIANFFGNQAKAAKSPQIKKEASPEQKVLRETKDEMKREPDAGDEQIAQPHSGGKQGEETSETSEGKPVKRPHEATEADDGTCSSGREKLQKAVGGTAAARPTVSPRRSATTSAGKKRSATSNGTAPKANAKKGDGSRKITAFFNSQ